LLLRSQPAHRVQVAHGITVGELSRRKLGREPQLVDVTVARKEEHPVRVALLQADQRAGHADVARPLVRGVAAKNEVTAVRQREQRRISRLPAQDGRGLHQRAEVVPVALDVGDELQSSVLRQLQPLHPNRRRETLKFNFEQIH